MARWFLILGLLGACGSVKGDSPDDAAGSDGMGVDMPPAAFDVTSVTPPFLAHGARITIHGSAFVGITSVNIGGQALVPDEVTATTIVIDPLPDNVSTGMVSAIVQKGAESKMLTVNVGRLLINEVDPVPDTREFIELIALSPNGGNVTGMDVSGYVLVAFDYATNKSVNAIAIAAKVNTDGLMLMRGPGVVPAGTLGATSIIDYAAAFLPNSEAGVAIYEGSVTDFPLGTDVRSERLIDSLVYEADDDTTFPPACTLVTTLYGAGDTCAMDEDVGDDQNLQDVGRCVSSARNRSAHYRILNNESPGGPNDCVNVVAFTCPMPACP